MKKIYALLLAFVLCLSSLTVFAAEEPALSVNDVKAERNEYVYVPVVLEDCDGANTLSITFEYDSNVLQKMTNRCAWTNEGDLQDFSINKNEGVWYDADANGVDGEICKLAFRVNAEAVIGKTTVKCTVIAKAEDDIIGTYTATGTVEVTCVHVAADDAVGTKVDDTNHKYKCANCGTEITEAHIWDKGIVTKPATEEETGVKEYTCTFCKAKKTEDIPKLEVEDDDEGDEPGGDTPGGGTPGGDTPGGDTPGGDTPGGSGNEGDSGNEGGTTPETNQPETSKPSKPAKPATKPENSVTTPETEESAPAVEIEEIVVKETVAEIEKAEEGKEVVVEMKQENGKVATVVPVEILEAVSGKDVDVVLDMGEYSWTINGKDVEAENLKDINLEVTIDSKAIKEDVVKDLAGKDATRQISLTHDGEFNFKATLKVNVGKEFVGKFGNLYYHNNGKFEFMNAAKVDEKGDVELKFDHASDYVVVLGEERTADDQDTSVDVPETEEPGDDVTTNNEGGNAGPIIAVVGVIAAIAVAAFFFLKKK